MSTTLVFALITLFLILSFLVTLIIALSMLLWAIDVLSDTMFLLHMSLLVNVHDLLFEEQGHFRILNETAVLSNSLQT